MIVLKQMRDMETKPRIERMHGKENHAPKPLKKKLVCDVCNREDGAKLSLIHI